MINFFYEFMGSHGFSFVSKISTIKIPNAGTDIPGLNGGVTPLVGGWAREMEPCNPA